MLFVGHAKIQREKSERCINVQRVYITSMLFVVLLRQVVTKDMGNRLRVFVAWIKVNINFDIPLIRLIFKKNHDQLTI